jgi:general secretion pathway protein D
VSTIEAQVNNLLLEAYDAKDKNDLATARAKAGDALTLAPNNEVAKSLIAELDSLSAPKAPDNAVSVPPPSAELPPAQPPAAVPAQPKNQTLLTQVVQKHQALFEEVEKAREYADLLSNYGEHDKAIAVIDGALGALPDNSGLKTNLLQQRLLVKRQEIIGRRQGVNKNLDVQVVTTMHEAEAQNNRRAKDAMQKAELALTQIKQGHLDDAQKTLEEAFKILPANIALEEKARHLRGVQARLYEQLYINSVHARDLDKAEFYLGEHARISGKDSRGHIQLLADFEAKRIDPNFRSVKSINPKFVTTEAEVKEKLIRGKKLYLYGDYEGAKLIFDDVLLYQPNNAEAKASLLRIAQVLQPVREMNQLRTHRDYIAQVSNEWVRPDIYERPVGESATGGQLDPVIQIMRDTRIPTINLRDLQLNKVVETLVELSAVYSPNQKPINMTIRGLTDRNPTVTIVMTDVSLDKLLDFITKQVNFNYIVEDGVVVVRPDAGSSDIDTETFTLNQAGMRRMGKTAHQAAAQASVGSFSSGAGPGGIAATGGDEDSEIIKRYLQRHNVIFDGIPGVGLSYDGTEVSITHNRQNLERCRKLLEKLSDVTLISVQSKFIDISESAMRELATNFTLSRETASGGLQTKVKTGNRTLDATFGVSSRGRDGQIIKTTSSWQTVDNIYQQVPGETSTFTIPGTPPILPGNIRGTSAPVLDTNIATIGGWDLRLLINALESHESSDVLAAPNVTVTSGDSEGASIELYQNLLYPAMYNEPTVQVSSNGSSGYNNGGGGEASAAIKAATPSEIVAQKVGITFKVNASYSKELGTIDLRLAPEIVEFEGFIEYGGVSVAVAGGTTVTAPSGFFQPVFSHRKVTTNVSVYDGATVVIGGLTREEVKTVEDKVPVLGDIPIIGGAFRSKGKASNKRNLMIFVTANRMTPGGAPKNSVDSVSSTAIFANPTLITPSGSVQRQINTGSQPKGN